jgi:hypothetical protein
MLISTQRCKAPKIQANRCVERTLFGEISSGTTNFYKTKQANSLLIGDLDGQLERPTTRLQDEESFDSSLNSLSDFILIWEHAILPFLTFLISEVCGPGFAVGLRRGRTPESRTISVMTEATLSESQRSMIEQQVRKIVPRALQETTGFEFRTGILRRLARVRSRKTSILDDICEPKNPYYYHQPIMGDSIGVARGQGDDNSTATLGPCLIIGDNSYWLMNFHPLETASGKNQGGATGLRIEHPSPDDRNICAGAGHSLFVEDSTKFALGEIIATCGTNTKKTRVSKNQYRVECEMEYPPDIVVDWALCDSQSTHVNTMRKPASVGKGKCNAIISLGEPMGGASVNSTGRTSGLQQGEISFVPELIDGKMNGTGKTTREWCVVEPHPYDDEDGWTRSGIGVSGDSGAAIVDNETNALVGQLWGRNSYEKGDIGSRVTFFTPISDIFDDIQEQFSESKRPQLPQHGEDAPQYSFRPVCYECFAHHRAIYPMSTETLEPDSPGLDITKSENENNGMMTPMRELMASDDMTPMEDEPLTPETFRSPDYRRERALLFRHTGPSISDSSTKVGTIDANVSRSFPNSSPEILELQRRTL